MSVYTLQLFHLIESDRTELLEAVTEKNIPADERTNIGPAETYGQNVSPPLLDICMHFTYNYKLIC